MLDYILKIAPVLIVLLLYFVRLEIRLTRITTDIEWIKTYIVGHSNPDDAPTQQDQHLDLPAQG